MPCNHCDKCYTDQSALTKHFQSAHEGIMKACNQCDYQTAYQRDLTRHIQYKHEVVKYACDQCDYHGSKDALRYHLKMKHL